ncbi:hypothetical protein PGUG_02967 [Meyerozyma guilliermondii ATCC 6260]|uniref:protein-tyrosine-phosphatase n=1 Tax=Meyerozyma guilliermondii (strain ATCC 6260 / CBS 566 / DSM 6381 / JCM 1539 / NBRC 10279 / NRRL Y-324) TaxID=294746 RepID=A5DI66_PICGU|nr:uncharacterized protein PGUG_02967 [Meyerozyma guilliermondii ATCC 6260]EDK38869.2 hypothetical protein PGUG_02967 [Meyerozyma guilliermondii ATCC 6260]
MSSSPAVCPSPGYGFPPTGGDYFSAKKSPSRLKSSMIPKELPEDFSMNTQPDYFTSGVPQKDDYFVNFPPKDTSKAPTPPVNPHKQYNSFGSTLSHNTDGHSAHSSMTFDDMSDTGSIHKPRSTTEPRFSFHGSQPSMSSHKSSSPPPLMTLSSLPHQSDVAKTTPPGFTKHNTSPMSLSFGCPSTHVHPHHAIPIPKDSRPLIEQLPHVSYLPSPKLSDTIENSNTLIVDVRPFADYIKSHIKGAINICLPSTLLKRQSYTISRCVTSMPAYEKSIVSSFVDNHQSHDAVILYDTTGSSSNLYHLACKFGDKSIFKSRIYILDEAYAVFKEVYPDNIVSGTADISSNKPGKEDHLSKSLSSCSLTEETKTPTLHFTPILSNFKLPDTPRNTFKIRHNEEVLSPQLDSRQTITLENSSLSNEERAKLPNWILQTVDNPITIERDFQTLEKFEKKRLLHALSGQKLKRDCANDSHDASSPTFVPSITSGIELGHKNRYKDIFVYEHSRVRLQEQQQQACDYINASYIDPSGLQEFSKDPSKLQCNYIATQGPLNSTIGDFWKCALDNHCSIIVSLTGETENGVDKCSPFWRAGTYTSNSTSIVVSLEEDAQIDENLLLRRFTVSMGNNKPQSVLQIHLLSWPDMGSISKSEDILTVVFLKQFLSDKLKSSDGRAMIHCSAGCGRTGTLCAIDTILSLMKTNGTNEFERDPVYAIVNSFRNQRISMVQNLRQYNSIYDTILLFLKDEANGTRHWRHLEDNCLVQNFLNT